MCCDPRVPIASPDHGQAARLDVTLEQSRGVTDFESVRLVMLDATEAAALHKFPGNVHPSSCKAIIVRLEFVVRRRQESGNIVSVDA